MINHSCASAVFVVLFVLAGVVLAALPIAVWFYYEHFPQSVQPHTLGWLIASCFVGVTLPISVWEIVMHLRYMTQPQIQVPVVRVLWMVPIYAVDSWLALRFSWSKYYKGASLYINTARECYEAFVIYNFLVFLARYVALRAEARGSSQHPTTADNSLHVSSTMDSVLEPQAADSPTSLPEITREPSTASAGEDSIGRSRRSQDLRREDSSLDQLEERLKGVLSRKPPVGHIIPLCWMRAWDMKSTAHHKSCEFYTNVKAGVVQYIVLKLLCTLSAFILKPLNRWGEGKLEPTQGFFWAAMVTNFSQAWAIYCLILFYKGCRHELQPMNPIGKFLAVKAVVFFSFWQSLAIAILVKVGVIEETEIYPEASELAAATQDFLICIEMFLFALVHHRVFSYREFIEPTEESVDDSHEQDFTSSLKAMLDLDDLWTDTRGTLKPILPKQPYRVMKVPPPRNSRSASPASAQSDANGSRDLGDSRLQTFNGTPHSGTVRFSSSIGAAGRRGELEESLLAAQNDSSENV